MYVLNISTLFFICWSIEGDISSTSSQHPTAELYALIIINGIDNSAFWGLTLSYMTYNKDKWWNKNSNNNRRNKNNKIAWEDSKAFDSKFEYTVPSKSCFYRNLYVEVFPPLMEVICERYFHYNYHKRYIFQKYDTHLVHFISLNHETNHNHFYLHLHNLKASTSRWFDF